MFGREDGKDIYLNELKQVFDTIETYDPRDNIGFRSLKNLGVWLTIYALTDEGQKEAVVNELKALAKHSPGDLKKKIDHLATPAVLKSIIEDYKKASGTFNITVSSPSHLNELRQRAKELNLADIVEPHSTIGDAAFAVEMTNTMQFQWISNRFDEPIEMQTGATKSFSGLDKINYLSSSEDQNINYGLVNFNNHLYHVVRTGTVQAVTEDGYEFAQRSDMFFIEPLDANDQALLQENYFNILNRFQKTHDHKKFRELAALKNDAFQVDFGGVSDSYDGQVGVDFTFHIPELVDTLQTQESRLGPYAVFVGKTIGNIPATSFRYRGERELKYDKTGGEIRNMESGCVEEGICGFYYPATIKLDYAISGPFMMVYLPPNHVDCYAFKISNPTADLVKVFSDNDACVYKKAI